jgi:hypothetical protein
MIEINLLEKKRSFKAPVVAGIDFAQLPWKMIILSFILIKYPVEYFDEFLKGEIKEKQVEVTNLNKQYKKLRLELRKNRDIKDQLVAFNNQIEKLKQRSEQVNNIIKLKTNPRYLLEKVARSTPNDLWLVEFILNDKNEVIIKGEANSYQSIGEFILSANDSPFFGRSLQLADSKTVEEKVQGVQFRKETFQITGKVEVFNPFLTGR